MMSPRVSRRVVSLTFLIAVVAASACGGGDKGVAPVKPTAVQALQATAPTASVGAALATAPTFSVTDAAGNALANIAVTVTVASGGGSIVGAPTRTSAGATSVGTWTLGTTAGANTLTVSVSGLTPLTISATGTPGPASQVVVSAGNSQTALAGAQVATPLAAAVKDQYGNGIANVPVTFQSSSGGGVVTPGVLTTNASGIAAGATWRLGNKGGTQSATASANGFSAAYTASIQSTFTLDLRFYGPAMSPEATAAFTNAANRIRAAIIANPGPVQLLNADMSKCDGGPTVTLNEVTNGVIIYASVAPIDGAGKILAQAGPCFQRGSNSLPAAGVMLFDSADIQNYINTGRFESIVLHEMNHVVGFGTIWFDKNLLQNSAWTVDGSSQTGSTNPRYTGAAGVSNCLAAGGNATACTLSVGVAVEATGGYGTADGHWRESVFDAEMMTGFVEATGISMPWSAMSIGQFQDLGYAVNLLAADSYTVPSLLAMARASLQAASADQPAEVLHQPRFVIGSGGQITPVKREIPR